MGMACWPCVRAMASESACSRSASVVSWALTAVGGGEDELLGVLELQCGDSVVDVLGGGAVVHEAAVLVVLLADGASPWP